jgi:hypothetical protein
MLTEAKTYLDCLIATERFRQFLPHSARFGDYDLLNIYVYKFISLLFVVYKFIIGRD